MPAAVQIQAPKRNLSDPASYSLEHWSVKIQKAGTSLVVYTYTHKGTVSTDLCSGNKLIAEAGKDIRTLNYLIEPPWKNKYLQSLFWGITFALVMTIIVLRSKSRYNK